MSQPTTSSEIQEELDYRVAVADYFLDLSESCILDKSYDGALRYIELAVQVFTEQNRELTSLRVESNLRKIASLLPTEKDEAGFASISRPGKPVCLHVLNEALAFGGHTTMAARWIQLDDARIHSVALLGQRLPPPAEFVKVVSESGGTIYYANENSSPLQKAAWLRDLARSLATYVALHIDTSDLITPVAFGVESGPPTLMVNHAAHLFWTGAPVPDIVVNCRGSRLEEHWTKVYRGVKNYATIPIPLPEPGTLSSSEIERDELKSRAREIIGIPKESIVILTVGASHKYKPFGEIDFLKTSHEILEAVPEAFLLAAGVIEDDRWRQASEKLGFRLRALGSLSQSNIALLHQASDLYIEGFPFGSTTALIEAGLQGLPVALTPAECPPPYGSDGVALDDTLERPASIEQYKSEVVRLCRNPAERASVGMRLRKAILAHHTGAGWKQYLTKALQALPQEHGLHPIQAPLRTPTAIHEYWCGFQKTRVTSRGILEQQIFCALSSGLRPKITAEIKLACKNAKRLRAGGTIPSQILSLLCNYCFPLLPLSWARIIFRATKFFFCGELLGRLRKKAVRLLWKPQNAGAPYGQYHYIPEHSQWTGAASLSAPKIKPEG